MIRVATSRDLEALTRFAVASVTKNGPKLPVYPLRIKTLIAGVIAQGTHYLSVFEHEGKIVAALGALVSPGFWFYGNQVSVMLFHTTEPGAGIALIRDFKRWVEARPFIKVSTFSLEADADPRIAVMLKRIGFSTECPQMAYIQGAQS